MGILSAHLRFSRAWQVLVSFYIKLKIRQAEVVSFDVFDTLLNRPFCEPKDVFLFLSKRYDEPEFYQARLNAEKEARKKLNRVQVTYDELYHCMPSKFHYMKELEAQFEYETIYPQIETKKFYDYAIKKGKKVVFTTDMYYSQDFLLKLLKKNGYSNSEDIYVSGYLRRSKYQNTLFPYVVQTLKVKASKVLHIGDNRKSDYLAAKAAGLKAVYITSGRNKLFKLFPRLEFFWKNNNQLTSSVILGLIIKRLTLKHSFKNYWEEFGYVYGGGVCYGLCKFIANEMQRDKRRELVCVARDGYTIEKIINLIAPSVKTHYVIASRAINLLTSLEVEHELPWTHKSESIIRMFKEISPEFNRRCKGKSWNSNSERTDFINKNRDILQPLAEKILECYKNYIKTFNIRDKRIAIFDVAAGACNSYKCLQRVFPDRDILGLYWVITAKNHFNLRAYQKDFIHKFGKYQMIELLITAPELPVKNFSPDGKIIRLDNKYEKRRAVISREISRSEVQFANDYLSTFSCLIDFDVSTLIELVNSICNFPSMRDRWHFWPVFHGFDEAHTRYGRLIHPFNFRDIRHEFSYIKYSLISHIVFGRYKQKCRKRMKDIRKKYNIPR